MAHRRADLHEPYVVRSAPGRPGSYARLADRRSHRAGRSLHLCRAGRPAARWRAVCLHPEALPSAGRVPFGWTLLLVVQSGGMPRSRCLRPLLLELSRWRAADGSWRPPRSLHDLVNCLARALGQQRKSALMVMKVLAIAPWSASVLAAVRPVRRPGTEGPAIIAVGAALVPVRSRTGAGRPLELRGGRAPPPRARPAARVSCGVGRWWLYIGVNVVCIRVAGAGGLAATTTPPRSDAARGGRART